MATRKLQGEIDRCLKKVGEGIEEFSELYDKIYATTNQSQKEKLEGELKREIKKLQRLRDQIKTWISSNEIKDKRALTDARKNIESQMERFKACEREMKTKQYSKEGLQAKEKLDPAEVARMESSQWITGVVDKLQTQVDVLEAEQESIGAAKTKRSAKADAARLRDIDARLERHKFHMTQLETMLRMLENDALQVDDVETVKDSVEYYIDSCQEPDFDEDTEMYDHLNLTEDDVVGYLDEHHGSAESLEKAAEEEAAAAAASGKKRTSKDESTPDVTSAAPISPAKKTATPISKAAPAPKSAKSPPPAIKAIPAASPVPAPPVTVVKPPVKYSAAASAGLKDKPVTVVTGKTSGDASVDRPADNGMSFSTIVSSKPQTPSLPTSTSPIASIQHQQPPSMSSSSQQPHHIHQYQQHQQPIDDSYFPSNFADLITSYKSCQMKTYGRGDEALRNQYLLMTLESSFQQCPDVIDSERPPLYIPDNPSRKCPPYFPKQPMLALSSSSVFERFDIDTLFFLFYYRQNTREQILAARELKRQSWRFHKKYLTWFQRHEEPKSITDEYEQGTYVYFDYEGAWCQRKKTEFTFEYRFLEGE
eukprot:Partr_v1_DN26656_c0_g1_i4_m69506 putative CCR4-NOT transcription complex, subunit 3